MPNGQSGQRPPARAGWTASDERAWEHRQLALALEQSQNDTLRMRKENAAKGSTEDADYLYALSLAQQLNGPSAASQPGTAGAQPTQAAMPQTAAPVRVQQQAAPSTPAPQAQPPAAAGKKKGLLRSLSKSLRRKSSKSDSHGAGPASEDGASTVAGSVSGQPEDHWLPPSEQQAAGAGPFPHPGQQSHAQHSRQSSTSQWAEPGPPSPTPQWARSEQSTPAGLSPSVSHGSLSPEPPSPASPLRAAAPRCYTPGDSPGPEPFNESEAIDQSGYRELLLDTQMLYKDLENTLGDKQHTMGRLRVRGEELQADMRSVRHRIDDPAGWEAFSLYSQQQADLESRLRLGARQAELLQSCMNQLQDLEAFVFARRPHPQDALQLQDATFSELLRRLQKLEVDPQLPTDVAAAASGEGSPEDAASRIRAVCQSSANIDFEAALDIARRARVAKEHQVEEDQAQEAAQELVRALSRDDEQQDHWQPPSIMRRGSWDDIEESAVAMDEYEDAEEELEDEDLPAAAFPVPQVAGPFSFQGRAPSPAVQAEVVEDSPEVPPMSESPVSIVSDEEDWADADAEPPAAGYHSPAGMSRVSSYEDHWMPVYGASAAGREASPPALEPVQPVASELATTEPASAEVAQDRDSHTALPAAGLSLLPGAMEQPAEASAAPDSGVGSKVDDPETAELEARLAALSRRPAAAGSAQGSSTLSPAQPAEEPPPAAGGTDRDLAQVLREAEARFAARDASEQQQAGASHSADLASEAAPDDLQPATQFCMDELEAEPAPVQPLEARALAANAMRKEAEPLAELAVSAQEPSLPHATAADAAEALEAEQLAAPQVQDAEVAAPLGPPPAPEGDQAAHHSGDLEPAVSAQGSPGHAVAMDAAEPPPAEQLAAPQAQDAKMAAPPHAPSAPSGDQAPAHSSSAGPAASAAQRRPQEPSDWPSANAEGTASAAPPADGSAEAIAANAGAAAQQPLPVQGTDDESADAAERHADATVPPVVEALSGAQQHVSDAEPQAAAAAEEAPPAQPDQMLERQEDGSGSFSFPAPAAIAAAAVGTSPRGPPGFSAAADAAPEDEAAVQAAQDEGSQPSDQPGMPAAEQNAPASGDTAVALEQASRALEQAAAAPAAEPLTAALPVPQPQAMSSAPVSQIASPVAGSPAANGSFGSYDRAAERRKREERQAALEAERKALAERRRLRRERGSGGSVSESMPVMPAKDAKARVRFAVEEGEAPGDKQSEPEAPRVSPRSALKQTSQLSPRGSLQRTSPPSARPPAGMRSRGSQEQLLKKAENIRHQLRDPPDIKQMSRIEKQFALMELQFLLGDHRAADRRQAEALVDQRPRASRASSTEDLGRLPEAERARVREQRRRERDRERARAAGAGGGGAALPARRQSSDGASVSSSDAGSGSVSAASAGRASSEARWSSASGGGSLPRRGSIPTMPGSAGLRTVSIPLGSSPSGSGSLRTGSVPHINGGDSSAASDSGSRHHRRGSRDGAKAAAAVAAPLSEEQLQALALEYRNLALEIRDFQALDLQEAASMLQRILAATKGRPSPSAVGVRAWPVRKVAALQEVVADWNELQHLTSALKQWRMLPDFTCSDEGTRIETYLNVVKQTTTKMALTSVETQQRFTTAGVPWSPDLLQGLRRAAMQPAKLYLERVLREAGSLGNSQSAQANGINLTRGALRLASQVQQISGGLDRDCSVLLKRVQNLQATLKP